MRIKSIIKSQITKDYIGLPPLLKSGYTTVTKNHIPVKVVVKPQKLVLNQGAVSTWKPEEIVLFRNRLHKIKGVNRYAVTMQLIDENRWVIVGPVFLFAHHGEDCSRRLNMALLDSLFQQKLHADA